MEFKESPGVSPILVLLNKKDEVIESIPLKELNREECNELLKSKGFVLKSEPTETKTEL